MIATPPTRRHVLACLAGGASTLAGCATIRSGEPGTPEDWLDVERWTGSFHYTRDWTDTFPHWQGTPVSFRLTVTGVLDLERTIHSENHAGYTSIAPATWSISGGGTGEATRDAWTATISGSGIIYPRFHLDYAPENHAVYQFMKDRQRLPVRVAIEGSESIETTEYHRSGFTMHAEPFHEIEVWHEPLPDAVGPLESVHEWSTASTYTDDDHRLEWWLDHTPPDYDEPEGHPCDDTEMREGLETADAEDLREGLASGLGTHGANLGPEHVAVTQPGPGDGLHYVIRLGYDDNQPRHTGECIVEAIVRGELPPGVEEGARHQVVGMVQEAGGRTRVSMRVVDVETTEVVVAGTGEAAGTGADAKAEAATDAAGQLEGFAFDG